jgi:hypothetical protein
VQLATQRYEEAKIALDELQKKSDEATSYFDELGISIYDQNGELKTALDLLWDLIDAYSGVESETIRSYEMNQLLGESYSKLKPFIKEGSDELKKMMQSAWDTNEIIGDEQVAAMNEASIAADNYAGKIKNLKDQYAAVVAEEEGFLRVLVGAGSGIELGYKIASEWLKQLFEGSGYKPSDSFISGYKKDGQTYINDHFLGQRYKYASGTNYAPGGLALVGERGPEIVDLPRGSKVYPNGVIPSGLGGTAVYETNTYNISIDAARVEEFNDIVRIAQGARVGMRRG